MMDGERGIYTRDGHFFSLEDLEWSNRAELPSIPNTDRANAVWSYDGRPTAFGQVSCDEAEEICVRQAVTQYRYEFY